MSSACQNHTEHTVGDSREMIAATARMAEWISGRCDDGFPHDAIVCARHAILDWLAVTLAASNDSLVDRLIADALSNGETGAAGLVGRRECLSPAFAALVNGACSHALDYDDINKRMRGHPSVAIIPAVLAATNDSTEKFGNLLEAVIVGVEVAATLGEMMAADHYHQGFHTTGTVGTVAAAGAVCRVMRSTADQCETAIGLAATQAAGLRVMFGSMAKPLHAGKAAMNGLLAARWARVGVTASAAALESPNGFGPTLSRAFQPRDIKAEKCSRLAIEDNIFKYQAACFYTHSAMAALARLMAAQGIDETNVASIEVGLLPSLHSVCDIVKPQTGLQIKFSVRHLLAMTLSSINTADPHVFTDCCAANESLGALRQRISVAEQAFDSRTASRVTVRLTDGGEHSLTLDVGNPSRRLAEQESRLLEKFNALASAVLSPSEANDVSSFVLQAQQSDSLAEVFSILYRRHTFA